MNIFHKLTGPLGLLKAVDNIAGHVDEDSRVRIAALDQVIAHAEAAKAQIEAAVASEIQAALTAPATDEASA